jgi:hypothetical protein
MLIKRTKKAALVGGAAAIALSVLAACGEGDSSPQRSLPPTQSLQTLDDFCKFSGLPERKRHTIVVVDEHALAAIAEPKEMPAKNATLQQRMRDYVSAEVALVGGVIEARERVSIMVAPIDGSAARLVFSGCVPGLSEEDAAALPDNGFENFTSGGAKQKVDEGQDKYGSLTSRSLANAARVSNGDGSTPAKTIEELGLLKSVAEVALANRSAGSVTRYVLLADLSKVSLPGIETVEDARKAGFEAGLDSTFNFSGSDILVALTPGSNELVKQYFDARILASGGRLAFWGDGRPVQPQMPPVAIKRFTGAVKLPRPDDPTQFMDRAIMVRLAWDINGDLTQSFLQEDSRVVRMIPITGRVLCTEDVCQIKGDDSGFAQAWSEKPGGDPEHTGALPFGGARDISLTITGEKLTGTISDTIMSLNSADNTGVALEGTEDKNANW